jgi:TRAP-type uncharacterized transport system fused permease subunit
MGLTVFVMVVIANIPYSQIMVAALFPSLLYYFGLVIQADMHAARLGLVPTEAEKIPSLWKTLREGWQFIIVLGFLVWGLLYMRWAEITPYYASLLLFGLSFFRRMNWITQLTFILSFVVWLGLFLWFPGITPYYAALLLFVIWLLRNRTRVTQLVFILIFPIWGLLYMWLPAINSYYVVLLLFVLLYFNRQTMTSAFITIGSLASQMMALIMPFMFILVGLVITGMSASFAAGLVNLGGGNIYFILFMGLIACYLLGIVGFSVAAYIFLAISMAPALEQLGLNKMAVHLFLVFYTNLSILTPPIAIGAFVAGAMAGSDPMKTAWTAMKLGIVIYFIPIFFILKPELVLQGPLSMSAYYMFLVILGTVVMAGGLSGYMWGCGKVNEAWKRLALVGAGFLVAVPQTMSSIIGLAIALIVYAIHLVTRKPEPVGQGTTEAAAGLTGSTKEAT